jgi:GT2 family glycosyltransferase
LLNPDAMLKLDTLQHIEHTLKAHQNIAILGGQIFDEQGVPQDCVTLEGEKLKAGLQKASWILGAFMVVKASAWRQLEGMDEGFFLSYEETDFVRRAREAGLGVYFDPNVQVVYIGAVSSDHFRLRSFIEVQISKRYYHHKHGLPEKYPCTCGSTVRLFLNMLSNGILSLSTLGLCKRFTQRCKTYAALFVWYLWGCPRSWGIRKIQ